MSKWALVLCCVVYVNACAGFGAREPVRRNEHVYASGENVDLNHWVTLPGRNELAFLGVSGRQSRPGAEIDIAREHAAMKVAMFHGLQVEVFHTQSIGAGFFDYYLNTSINVEFDRNLDTYLDKLSFDPEKDIFKRNNAVFVRFTYPGSFPGDINYISDKNANGSPRWTTSPPQIDGFIAGVGFVRRQERIRDALIRSAEAAAASIVSNLSSSIHAGETATITQTASFVQQHSRGSLTGFFILETWIDPDTEAVWTLAIARSAN